MEIQWIHPRNLDDLAVEMVRLDAPRDSLGAIGSRAMFQVLRVRGLAPAAALALKDEITAAGGDAALPLAVYQGAAADRVDVMLSGTFDTYRKIAEPKTGRPPELERAAAEIKTLISRLDGSTQTPPVNWPDGMMNFGNRTYVMGIINATPDSFYDGGRNLAPEAAMASVEKMVGAGVDMVDIGGESTRPGSMPVSAEDEIKRTAPLIKEIRRRFPNLRISIDTTKTEVAAAALEAGAGMINDISGLRHDPGLAGLAADADVPVCIMHMLGTPADMQKNPEYPDDVCYEINSFFRERIGAAVSAGINEHQIILDPGIGFGKTVEHNLEILNRLDEFRCHGRPLLVGASRKSFIGKTLELEADERLEGSLAAAVLSVTRGADILRVHDVLESVRAVRLADAVVRKKRMLEHHD